MTNGKIFANEMMSEDELDCVSGGKRIFKHHKHKDWKKLRERYENHIAIVKMQQKFMAAMQEFLPMQKSQRTTSQATKQNLQQMLQQATAQATE